MSVDRNTQQQMKKQFGASSDVVSNFLRLISDYGHNK